jgi:hypothetical protein
MVRHVIAACLCACLSACAAFTVPVYEDREAAQAECLESAWCRAVIGSQPAWTERYVSDRRDCKAHALEIAQQAANDGKASFFAIGTIRGGEWHAVAVVDHEGERYAFDNGAVSATPIPFADLKYHMTVKMLTTERAILQ